jgi:hypothetical protein
MGRPQVLEGAEGLAGFLNRRVRVDSGQGPGQRKVHPTRGVRHAEPHEQSQTPVQMLAGCRVTRRGLDGSQRQLRLCLSPRLP